MSKLPKTILLYLCLLSILVLSCKKDRISEEEVAEMNNNGIELNAETMSLGTFFGNVFSGVVLVNVQGGPSTSLMTTALKELLTLTNKDNDYFIFNVHQAQTKTPEKLATAMTLESANKTNQESIDNLAKVIQYFKLQDKRVYVLGIGYGAYLTQELIVREGHDIADKYLLMAGRLDMPELISQSFSEGNTGGFIDGKTPFKGAPSTLTEIEKNQNKLLGSLAKNQYTEALAKYNDLTNITYCFGTADESFGQLTQNEKALLITRQATILEWDGGHVETIENLLDKGFSTAF